MGQARQVSRGAAESAEGESGEVGRILSPQGEGWLTRQTPSWPSGSIDTHTHLDPSMFWDPQCDPMPQHGVTTALVGNCSLCLGPLRPEHVDELMDVLSYIEDIPIDDFRIGVPWNWSTW